MNKFARRFLALLMAIVLMSNLVLECAATAKGPVRQKADTKAPVTRLTKGLSQRSDTWDQPYETVWDQAEADALRTTDPSANILVAAEESTLSGLTFGEMVSVGSGQLKLTDTTGRTLSVEGNRQTVLYGAELDLLTLRAQRGETVSLRLDDATKIPEIILEGDGSFRIEGSGALGLVRVTGNAERLLVAANCSVLNESQSAVALETADGSTQALEPGAQKETELSAFLILFMADGQVYRTETAEPGAVIPFPEENPTKEGHVFTTWYEDEALREPFSRYAVAEGQTTLYARFVPEGETVHVTLNTMGGQELEPLTLGRGETLLTRPVQEICTQKEGYTFGGWCTDEACTESFSYSQPVTEDVTLYAYFVSNEAQEVNKDGNIAGIEDLDWQGGIALRVTQPMSAEELLRNIELIPGAGISEPTVTVTSKDGGFVLYGSCYEKDGQWGFEPGSTFTLKLPDGVRFEGYSDDADTGVVSIYKEQIEHIIFSEDLNYVLWDDVLTYAPVTEIEGEDQQALPETGTAQNEEVQDQQGENAQEIEQAQYLPGSVMVRGDAEYKAGDLIAFYDGEIGRDEKSMSAYTEGDFDGYVLFAQVLETKVMGGSTYISYCYANPEDYLAEFEVHTTEQVDLENKFSEDDLDVLKAHLTRQVEENEELKAQMLISVMTAPETQRQLDELYGAGVYTLAGMSARLEPGKPTVELSVSGSEVSARISISATVTLLQNNRVMLTVEPTLAFTQSVGVSMNVDGGAVWIDMSVSVRSTSKIELTVTATSGGDVGVFTEAKETLQEIVKPEGIGEDDYETYDAAVSDLMNTMNEIVATSLQYNDLFDVLLLQLSISFYGIITLSFEVHFVGQIGVLATFGVEIVATSGIKIGFRYNFLKFKGSSYTEKLDSGVTNTIYLIGKVGVRVGLRLILSVSLCGIASAYISGSVYAYAELTGLFFSTTNLLTGANTSLGALNFEVGLDVVVNLGLKVNLLVKTIKKSWTVYSGRWPLWSTSYSSKMTYMDQDRLEEQWAKATSNANSRSVFGFVTVPMKTWDLMAGSCINQEQLFAQSGKLRLAIESMTVNGEAVGPEDPRYGVFTLGDASKGQNPGSVYFDSLIAGEYNCGKVELDLALIYEDNAATALVKKQVQRFHLEKNCTISKTTQNTNVVLYDWCARNWGLAPAAWDNTPIYETSFSESHVVGGLCNPNTTGTLDLAEIQKLAQETYPELKNAQFFWAEADRNGAMADVQYATPRISSFRFMTTANGVVRFDVYPDSTEYDVTYYLYVHRFEGTDGLISYHVNLDADKDYTLSLSFGGKDYPFTRDENGIYHLTLPRTALDGSQQPIWITTPEGQKAASGLTVTGREFAANVYLDLEVISRKLTITAGEGISDLALINIQPDEEGGLPFGSQVDVKATLEEGYGDLTVECEDETIEFTLDETENTIRFTMPAAEVALTVRAYRKHTITYQFNHGELGTYRTETITEKQPLAQPEDPVIQGMTFRGWYKTADCSGEAFVFGEKPLEDLTLYADWTCDVTVVFGPVKGLAQYVDETGIHPVPGADDQEHDFFTYSSLRFGQKLLDIVTPDYEGYQFMDWYPDAAFKSEKIDLASFTLTGGMTIYAKWARILDLTYVANYPDGTSPTLLTGSGYDGYPVPFKPETDPTFQHYTFTGWYRNAGATAAFDVTSDVLTGNTTLYAGWKAVDYTITYDLGGGTNNANNPATYTTKDSFTLAAPTRAGYNFVGWSGTGVEGTVQTVSVTAGGGGALTYTAHWTPIPYTITYEKTYGSGLGNPTTYNIESANITLEAPVREKYEFQGWVGTDLTGATKDVTIPTGSMGNRSYRATWTTTDATEKILESVALLLEGNPYVTDLVNFLTAADLASTESVDISEKLLPKVNEHLAALVTGDKDGTYLPAGDTSRVEVGAYAGSIQLTPVLRKTDRTGSDQQVYTYTVSVKYTDESNVEHTRDVEYTVNLAKLVPEVTMPTMKPMTYGQTVAESEVSENGKAEYSFQGADQPEQKLTVPGTFTWKDETTEALVPFGRNNGTEQNQYPMVFQPAGVSAELYAVVEQKVALKTQIGLMVEVTANSRCYFPGDTTANGKVYLYYVKPDGTKDNSAVISGLLQKGSFNFVVKVDDQYVNDDELGVDKTVLYSGYSLNPAYNKDNTYGENVYCLVNPDGATTTATIKKVPVEGFMSLECDETNNKTEFEYSLPLSELKLQCKMSYREKEIEGTWRWQDPADTLNEVGQIYKRIVFTPEDLVHYEIGSMAVLIYVKEKTVPVPTVAKLVYNGSKQTSGLQSDIYTVSDEGGIDAGTYTATLTLVKPDCYDWSGTYKDSITVSYTIDPATIVVNASPSGTMSYGQQLRLRDATETDAYKVTNVTAPTVTFNGKTINGTWEWDIANAENFYGSQPWRTRTSPCKVPINFTPANANDQKNLKVNPVTVSVAVVKSQPKVTDCGITASLYDLKESYFKLSSAEVSITNAPVNKFTGETVPGSWSWEDGSVDVPASGNYHYIFTPNDGECYDTASFVVPVTRKQPATVPYTVTNVESVDCIGGGYKNGITTNVFSGSTSGTINVPISVNASDNHQALSFTLNDSSLYVSGLKITLQAQAHSDFDGKIYSDKVPYRKGWYYNFYDSPNGEPNNSNYPFSRTGNTYTLSFPNMILWEQVTVQLVVKSTASSTSLMSLQSPMLMAAPAADTPEEKKIVEIPEILAEPIYNGSLQTSGLEDLEGVYEVIDDGGIDAGDYEAALILVDPERYCWPDTEEATILLPYTIAQAAAEVTGEGACNGMVQGQRLMLAGQEGDDGYFASNIYGLAVSFGGNPVAGRWEWDLDTAEAQYGPQPWSAREEAYQVPVTFIPADADLAKNLQPISRTVPVRITEPAPAPADPEPVTDPTTETNQEPTTQLPEESTGETVTDTTKEPEATTDTPADTTKESETGATTDTPTDNTKEPEAGTTTDTPADTTKEPETTTNTPTDTTKEPETTTDTPAETTKEPEAPVETNPETVTKPTTETNQETETKPTTEASAKAAPEASPAPVSEPAPAVSPAPAAEPAPEGEASEKSPATEGGEG